MLRGARVSCEVTAVVYAFSWKCHLQPADQERIDAGHGRI